MAEPKTEIVTAQWPKALADEAREAARQHDRSLSWVIRQAVRDWLTKLDREAKRGGMGK